MQVQNTGASNAIAGSVLSQVATATQLVALDPGDLVAVLRLDARRSRRRAWPCSASRTFCDMVALHSSSLRRSAISCFALGAELAVTAAGLDAIHQHDQRVEHLLGPRRAAGDVDVDGDDLIAARHRRVVLVEAAGRRAHAERDHPLGLGHLIEHALERRALLLGDRADDHQQIALARREPRELGAEPRDVVLRPGDRHELHAAARGDERVREQRELAAPVASRARACSASPTSRRPRGAWWLALLPSDRLLSPDVGERDDEDRDEHQHLGEPEHADADAVRPGACDSWL